MAFWSVPCAIKHLGTTTLGNVRANPEARLIIAGIVGLRIPKTSIGQNQVRVLTDAVIDARNLKSFLTGSVTGALNQSV
jgi:hypothetical protein